jgi:hypothetical protein
MGHEPGRGERAIVAGIRVASSPDGSIVAAADRLPSTPTSFVALPERLGGGFLFALGKHLWRSAGWLTPAAPVFTGSSSIAQVLVGLDRAYVRTTQGVLTAIDPRTGTLADLGSLPATPSVVRLAALDAWRAVAVADLRGALVTLDAGSTWRRLPLPIDPGDVVALDESLAVGGLDETRQMQWWEVRADGQTGRLPSPPTAQALQGDAPSTPEPMARMFGPRPLVAALEDGWPLVDGSAIVARDGALARVRLSDGALVESATDAFPLKPARCHPLPLARPGDPGAFGFVCGEPRGPTAIYRWDAPAGRLVEMRRFDSPRVVLSSGNGALAVRGSCDPEAEATPPGAPARPQAEAEMDQVFCLLPPGGAWTEMHFRGDDVDRARLVVLGDGRVALVRPPRAGDLSSARLTITDGSRSTHVPLAWPPVKPDAARVLRLGTWMDGFEERRPGVLGGWVDGAGSVIGLEITLAGETRVGEYIHDAGAPVVSGRWGLGWTPSRRGFETVDGGMTWRKDIDVPEPITPARLVRERACGPIGCIAAGWLRVGWGGTESTPPEDPPVHLPRPHAAPALDLDCRPVAPHVAKPTSAVPPREVPPQPLFTLRPWPGSAAVSPSSAYGTVTEFRPCLGRSGPPLPAGDRGLQTVDVTGGLERALRGVSPPLACIHTWGPKSGDWDQLGRWQVRWLWPWGAAVDARSSTIGQAPWPSLDGARRSLGQGGSLVFGAGDDPDHALLVARHTAGGAGGEVFVLESDRAPAEVRRPGGDPLADVESATRAGGRWYVSTAQSPGELTATVVWLVDGANAREIARVPRAGTESRPIARLVHRTDGRAVGLVVDGQPDADRGTTMRWVVSVDLESGTVGDPEALAPTDFSDREVSFCTGDDGGWVLDAPYPGAIRVHAASGTEAGLQSVLARMRVTRDHACLERAVGVVEAPPEAFTAPAGAQHPRAEARTIDIGVLSGRIRYALRCSRR